MPTPTPIQRTQTACLLIVAAVALGAALHWLAPVLVPFTLAYFLSVVLAPIVAFMHDKLRLPIAIGTVLTILLGVLVMLLVGGLVAQSVAAMRTNSESYAENIRALWDSVRESRIGEWLELDSFANEDPDRSLLDEMFPPGAVKGWIGTAANSLANVLSSGLLVVVFLAFILTGQSHGSPVADEERSIKRYLATKSAISAVTGLCVGTSLSLFGVELALVFGVLAFLLNFIPSLGSIVATLLPLPVVLFGDYSTGVQIAAIAVPGAIQLVIGNIIDPKVVGKSMGLHPVTVLLALIFWGMIWGPVGAVLAAPLTAVIGAVLNRTETTRPIAEALAGRFGGG